MDKLEDILGTLSVILFFVFLLMLIIVGTCEKVEPDLVKQQIHDEQMIGGW